MGAVPDLQCGIAPLGPPVPAQPMLLGLLLAAASQKKKQFNLEAWEKETLNTIIFKKNTDNKKAEKYYTNEETN